MITSAETLFSTQELVITLYVPLREFENGTDDELADKAMLEVRRYIRSERKRQERHRHLPKYLGGKAE